MLRPSLLLLVLLAAAFAAGSVTTAALALAVAAGLQYAGLLAERWLFFAEARHVVTLFYGASAV